MIDQKLQEVLESLDKDLVFYRDLIKEVSEDILKKDFSEHPVFVAHQHEVSLGEVILDKKDYGTNWTINASVLEELVEKKIVTEDKVASFKQTYKDPKKFICLFIVTQSMAHFVFVPYVKSHKPEESN